MRKSFAVGEVMRALGVAPSTASIIANLMSGKTNPDNFRSVEVWALESLEAPPQYRKVLRAIAGLLELDSDDIRVALDSEGNELWYLRGAGGQPTVTWSEGEFELRSVD